MVAVSCILRDSLKGNFLFSVVFQESCVVIQNFFIMLQGLLIRKFAGQVVKILFDIPYRGVPRDIQVKGFPTSTKYSNGPNPRSFTTTCTVIPACTLCGIATAVNTFPLMISFDNNVAFS